jgi:hypothetical protein
MAISHINTVLSNPDLYSLAGHSSSSSFFFFFGASLSCHFLSSTLPFILSFIRHEGFVLYLARHRPVFRRVRSPFARC